MYNIYVHRLSFVTAHFDELKFFRGNGHQERERFQWQEEKKQEKGR